MPETRSNGTRAARLLLKAIRSLPESEQQVVLGCLIERALDPAREPGPEQGRGEAAATPPLAGRPASLRAPEEEGLSARVARLALNGQTTDEIARAFALPEAVVRSAFRDAASLPDAPEPLASILRLVGDGRSRSEVAEELGMPDGEVAAQLEQLIPSPTQERFGAAVQRALHHRGALERLQTGLGARGPLEALGAAGSAGPLGRAGQQVVPVRFPEPQYRRLKEWCSGHGFSMAVVVRGLVERFLDDQDRRTA